MIEFDIAEKAREISDSIPFAPFNPANAADVKIAPVKVVQSSKTVYSENGFGKYEITVQTARIEGVFGWIDFDKYADGFWQVVWFKSRHNIPDFWWKSIYKASRELDDVVELLDKLHQDLIEDWL